MKYLVLAAVMMAGCKSGSGDGDGGRTVVVPHPAPESIPLRVAAPVSIEAAWQTAGNILVRVDFRIMGTLRNTSTETMFFPWCASSLDFSCGQSCNSPVYQGHYSEIEDAITLPPGGEFTFVHECYRVLDVVSGTYSYSLNVNAKWSDGELVYPDGLLSGVLPAPLTTTNFGPIGDGV